jgi:hypothetical protein
MKTRPMLFLLLPLAVAAACDRQTPTPAEPSAHDHTGFALTPELHQTIAELRKRYARYHDLDKAMKDGWTFVGPCVSDPTLGGMGDHYSLNADNELVRGDGHVDLAEDPDFLVYAPQKNGRTKLAALDCVIPFERWTQKDPPKLFGIPFRANPGFGAGVWMFHIWLFDPNPAGIFQDFNPNVRHVEVERRRIPERGREARYVVRTHGNSPGAASAKDRSSSWLAGKRRGPSTPVSTGSPEGRAVACLSLWSQ